MSERYEAALAMAARAHAGQMRKHSTDPYILHPIRVSELAASVGLDEDAQIAALLHDTLEDTELSSGEIAEAFGVKVLALVVELTNPSIKRKELPRAERKAIDREHIANASYEAVTIKAFDRADNLAEIDGHSKSFIKLYTQESIALAEAIQDRAHPEAMAALWGQINRLLIA